MKDENIISFLIEENRGYCERIKEARDLGCDETVRELCDEWGQFMCDASRDLLIRARDIEKLAKKYPVCRTEIFGVAKCLKKYAQVFSEIYAGFEVLQRNGTIPTNLSDLSDLLR